MERTERPNEPTGPSGAPGEGEAVVVRQAANEFEAGVLSSVLDEAGVPNRVIEGDGASLGVFGATGFRPRSVVVAAADADRARAALDAKKADSVDIDWDEVDVGEPADPLAARIAGRPDDAPRASRAVRVAVVLAVIVAAAGAAWLLTGGLAGP